MAGDRVLQFKITALNLVRKGVAGASRELAGLKRVAGAVSAAGRGLGRSFSFVRRQFLKMAAGVAIGAAGLALTLKKSFEMERFRIQFKILFGDMDKARSHMKMLNDFAAKTPFQIAGIAEASRQLHVFSDGVMGGAASLRLIGDASSAVGRPMKEVAFWVGRTYALLKSGQPFGEAALRLQEMAILTGNARQKMEALAAQGGKGSQAFNVLVGELERFEGGMAEASRTGEGLVSTLKDNLTLALADFGDVLADDAKGGIQLLIEWLQKLRSDGTIAEWAKKAREALSIAAEVAKAIAGGGEGRAEALGNLSSLILGALMEGAGYIADAIIRGAVAGAKLLAEGPVRWAEADRKALDELREKGEISAIEHKTGLITAEGARIRRQQFRQANYEEATGREVSAIPITHLKDRGREMRQNAMERLVPTVTVDPLADAEAAERASEIKFMNDKLTEMRNRISKAESEAGGEKAAAMYRTMLKYAADRNIGGAGPTWAKKLEDFNTARTEREQATKDRDEQFAKADALNRANARNTIAQLFKGSPMAGQAFADAKAASIAAARINGTPIDTSKAKPWMDVQKFMEKAIPRLEKESAAKAERVRTDQERLDERQRLRALSKLSPAEQLEERKKAVATLDEQIAKEIDPEKKVGLQLKREDELTAIDRAQAALEKDAGKGSERRSIGMGEVFEAIHGDRTGAKKPEDRIAANTKKANEILEKIHQKVGLR